MTFSACSLISIELMSFTQIYSIGTEMFSMIEQTAYLPSYINGQIAARGGLVGHAGKLEGAVTLLCELRKKNSSAV